MTGNEKGAALPEPAQRIIGGRIRALREQAGVRQEDVARVARLVGLKWARSSVTSLEAGVRQLDLEEAALLPSVLTEALGFEVGLTDLLPDDASVALGSGRLQTDGRTFRALLGGTAAGRRQLRPAPEAVPGTLASAEKVLGRVDAALRPWPEVAPIQLLEAAGSAGDLEGNVARQLGVSSTTVLAAAVLLFGRSLTAERDRLAQERTAGLSKRSAQTVRGHLSRQLVAQVRTEIDKRKDDHGAH